LAGTDRPDRPYADFVPDAALTAMAPQGVSIHATRVHLSSAPQLSGAEPIELATLRAYVKPPLLDEAAGLLAAGPASVIAYAFTSTCYLGGDGDDDALRARLEQRTSGTPVVTTCVAATQAMRVLGVERIALVHPPWVSADLSALGAAYFRRRGLDVVMAASVPLHANPRQLDPGDVYDWVRHNTPVDADAGRTVVLCASARGVSAPERADMAARGDVRSGSAPSAPREQRCGRSSPAARGCERQNACWIATTICA
jgi:maleate isomerase